MEDPDLPLVRALQGGDDRALDALMIRHREPLFRFLFRYTRNETVAADLAHETFVRAYFGIGRFRPGARFATWLHQIAINLCRDRLRSRDYQRTFWHEPLPLDDESRLTNRAPSPAAQTQSSEDVARVQELIDRLPHPLKAALILTAFDDRSQKEAADILGISPKAVETRIYRARRILAEWLGRI